MSLDLLVVHNEKEGVDLVSMLPLVEQLFVDSAPPKSASKNATTNQIGPKMSWSHVLRGFRDGFGSYRWRTNPLDEDLREDILRRGDFDQKVPLALTKTKYQHVDVYELEHVMGAGFVGLRTIKPPPTSYGE